MIIDREKFKTGIPIIDQQHEKYIDMVERLYRLCMQRPVRNANIAEEVQNVVNYAVEHFDTEEQLMQSVGYPFYEEHLAKHNVFRLQSDSFSRDLETKGISDVFVSQLTRWLIEWFRIQVLNDDLKLAYYLKQQNPAWGTEEPPPAQHNQR